MWNFVSVGVDFMWGSSLSTTTECVCFFFCHENWVCNHRAWDNFDETIGNNKTSFSTDIHIIQRENFEGKLQHTNHAYIRSVVIDVELCALILKRKNYGCNRCLIFLKPNAILCALNTLTLTHTVSPALALCAPFVCWFKIIHTHGKYEEMAWISFMTQTW